MNSLIIFEHELKNNQATLSCPKRLLHLKQTLKVKVDQELEVTVLNHGLTRARVSELDNTQIVFNLSSKIDKPISPEWHLLVGLSRPPTMKKILEHGASLGVKHFHFLPTTLSEKSYADSKIWEEEKTRELLCDGLSQSATYWELPKVTHYKSLRDLPDFNDFDKRILSLEANAQSMSKIDKSEKLVLAFGPERGFTAKEDETLRSQGFNPVRIANSTLRVEIAVFATLGQCHLLV